MVVPMVEKAAAGVGKIQVVNSAAGMRINAAMIQAISKLARPASDQSQRLRPQDVVVERPEMVQPTVSPLES